MYPSIFERRDKDEDLLFDCLENEFGFERTKLQTSVEEAYYQALESVSRLGKGDEFVERMMKHKLKI